MSNEDGNRDFGNQLFGHAAEKLAEYKTLLREHKRIEMQLERTRDYITQLNVLLKLGGRPQVSLDASVGGSIVGQPGNRAKGYPLRKPQWEGMTLFEITKRILEASPNDIYHADVLIRKVYEVESDTDVRRVKASFVSTLRRGAKDGLWAALKGNKYQAKTPVAARLAGV